MTNNGLEGLQKIGSILHRPIVQRIIGGLLVILSFGYLIGMLVHKWDDLVSHDWHIDYRQIILAFVCYSVALGFAVLGWALIMRHLTSLNNPSKHLKYYIYTNLLKRLPAPLLNILGRVYFYQQQGIANSLVIATSIVERGVIVLSGLIVYLFASPFMPLPPIWRIPLIPTAILIISILLIRPKNLRTIMRIFGQRDISISFRFSDLLLWLTVYSLVWIVGGMVLYICINSVYNLSFAYLPSVMGIWIASGLIPMLTFVAPILGLRDLTLSFFLGYLMPSHLAIAVALLTRVVLLFFEVIWGLVALSL